MGVSENALLARARGYVRRGTVLAALTLLTMLLYASAAWAETFTVTNLHNFGAGSLRAAINGANSLEGADRIVFADGVSGTITLGSTLPTITDSAGLTIDGGGDVAVSGDDAVQVFVIGPGGKLSLSNLTVADGLAFARGGGVFNGGGTLTVDGSTFSGNNSDLYGGGIFNDDGGALTVSGSTFSDNWASDYGGGVFNDRGADFTLSDSTFSGNSTADVGAGVANLGGTLAVTGSTFSGNVSDVTGGGITNEAGTLEVSNSTFSGNAATEKGGGIDSVGGSVEVVNSTFSGNGAFDGGGSISASPFGGTVTLHATIVAGNPIGDNCSGPILDGGYNIDDDGTCGFTPEAGSLPNTNPLLDPDGLQDNGGPTRTIALMPDSPAVDLVGQDACPPPSTDQRGVERPQGEACDSGAFELQLSTACTITGTSGVDVLTGTPGADVICGIGGSDLIRGRGGYDTLKGQGGADLLYGGLGKDQIRGGKGADLLFGEGGADSLFGGRDNDVLDSRDGVNGNDSLDGGSGTDVKVTDATEKSIVGFP